MWRGGSYRYLLTRKTEFSTHLPPFLICVIVDCVRVTIKRNALIRRNFLKAIGTAAGGGMLAGFEAKRVTANEGGPSVENPFAPRVVVFPAFEIGDIKGDTAGEFQRWYMSYDLDKKVEIPGANAPLYYNGNGLAVTPTGIGKSAAATTVTSVLSSPKLDLITPFSLPRASPAHHQMWGLLDQSLYRMRS